MTGSSVSAAALTNRMIDVNNQEDLKECLFGSIPYRLQSLRFCYRVCNLQDEPHPDYGSQLWLGETVNIDEDRPLWFDAVIESGLMYCRVLLEFLGITLDSKTGSLKQTDGNGSKRRQRKDDICITTFGLEKITVEEVISGFSYATRDEISRALSHVLEIANKTVAHLTAGPSLPGTFASLRLACRVVSDLVWRHLYLPLEKSPLLQDCLLGSPPVIPITEND